MMIYKYDEYEYFELWFLKIGAYADILLLLVSACAVCFDIKRVI